MYEKTEEVVLKKTNKTKQHVSSYFSIVDINGEPPARDPEDRCVIEEAREALGVQSGAGHQHLQVRSEPGNVFNQAKQDVCVECSLMSLIYDDHTGGGERKSVGKEDELAQQKE